LKLINISFFKGILRESEETKRNEKKQKASISQD